MTLPNHCPVCGSEALDRHPTSTVLKQFLEGSLLDDAAERVRAHIEIEQCPQCTQAVEWITCGEMLPDATPTRIGEYSVKQRLGHGAFGAVYRVTRDADQYDRAVKLLHPRLAAARQLRAEVYREAKAAMRVKSDNVLTVYECHDFDTVAGLPPQLGIVMEYVEGETLAQRLEQASKIGPREAARIVHDAALGLSAVHAKGMIHGDLKPSNILLEDRGSDFPRIKLVDFGVSRPLTQDPSASGNPLGGTPEFTSPEAIHAPAVADVATDIWALGVVLFQLLYCDFPFGTRSQGVDALRRRILDSPPCLPQSISVPRELKAVCLKCLAKDPSQRYGSALLLADDLQKYRDGMPVTARRCRPLERVWKWCRRRPVPALLATACLVVAVAALVMWENYTAQIRRNNQQLAQALSEARAAQRKAEARGLDRYLPYGLVFAVVDLPSLPDELREWLLGTVADSLHSSIDDLDTAEIQGLSNVLHVSTLAEVERRLGQLAPAREHLEQAIAANNDRPDGELWPPEFRQSVLRIQLTAALASVLSESDGFDAGWRRHQESIALLASAPRDSNSQQLTISVTQHLGKSAGHLLDRSDSKGAARLLHKTRELLEPLQAAPEVMQELAKVYFVCATIESEREHVGATVEWTRKAIIYAEKILSNDTSTRKDNIWLEEARRALPKVRDAHATYEQLAVLIRQDRDELETQHGDSVEQIASRMQWLVEHSSFYSHDPDAIYTLARGNCMCANMLKQTHEAKTKDQQIKGRADEGSRYIQTALAQLERAVNEGYFRLSEVENDPHLIELRSYPDYPRLRRGIENNMNELNVPLGQ